MHLQKVPEHSQHLHSLQMSQRASLWMLHLFVRAILWRWMWQALLLPSKVLSGHQMQQCLMVSTWVLLPEAKGSLAAMTDSSHKAFFMAVIAKNTRAVSQISLQKILQPLILHMYFRLSLYCDISAHHYALVSWCTSWLPLVYGASCMVADVSNMQHVTNNPVGAKYQTFGVFIRILTLTFNT